VWAPGGITVARIAIDGMIAHARNAAPAECCGVLIGTADRIVEAVPTRNIAESPTRFLIEPRDHIEARRRARGRGLEVVGFYHSHPQSMAEPSATDRAEASYPDHLYAIVGLRDPEPDVRLYRLTAGNFRQVPLVTLG
jgi:proteasome lid subunit RPN8/RPN11